MKTRILIFFTFILIMSIDTYSQNLSLLYEEFELFVEVGNNLPDTSVNILYNGDSLVLFIYDSLGQSEFCLYDTLKLLKNSGLYHQSLGVLIDYEMTQDMNSGETQFSLFEFYQPLPIGFWYSYDSLGNVVDSVNNRFVTPNYDLYKPKVKCGDYPSVPF